MMGCRICGKNNHGLNAGNVADRNNYTLSADYTNLEVYLNSLVADNLPPNVNAGADQVTWLGQGGTLGQEIVHLDATTSDDGPYAVLWTQVNNGAAGRDRQPQ